MTLVKNCYPSVGPTCPRTGPSYDGKPIGHRIINWKLKHVLYYRNKYEGIRPTKAELGSSWPYGLMSCHDKLRHNKHVNVERHRTDWCTHANIRHMYKLLKPVNIARVTSDIGSARWLTDRCESIYSLYHGCTVPVLK